MVTVGKKVKIQVKPIQNNYYCNLKTKISCPKPLSCPFHGPFHIHGHVLGDLLNIAMYEVASDIIKVSNGISDITRMNGCCCVHGLCYSNSSSKAFSSAAARSSTVAMASVVSMASATATALQKPFPLQQPGTLP